MRVELPGDNWAEIRPVEELKAGDKIAVERVVTFMQPADGGPVPMHAGIAEDMQMAMLSRVITAWSLQPPPPVTPEILSDLPIDVYNTLCEAIEDHMEVIRVSPNRRTPSA